MAAILSAAVRQYHVIFEEYADPRVYDYPMMKTPWPMFAVVAAYLYLVRNGPSYVQKPWKLDRIIQIYNIFQVVACFYLFTASVILGLRDIDFNFACEPIDYRDTPTNRTLVKYMWYYFVLKIIDLLDTVFIILRKKHNQLSYLHTFHHSIMVFFVWIAIKFIAGGTNVLMGVMNCFVHSVMYFYYFLTNYNPEFKKSLWWKKSLTQLQIFFLISASYTTSVIMDCGFPKWNAYLGLSLTSAITALFFNFYYKSYIQKKHTT